MVLNLSLNIIILINIIYFVRISDIRCSFKNGINISNTGIKLCIFIANDSNTTKMGYIYSFCLCSYLCFL
jgi:hypothetical protein